MKPKTLALMAIAGGCGLIAMLGVQQAMKGRQAPAKAQSARVLVALDNIETGMRLTKDNVSFQDRPTESLPADAVRSEEEYTERAARVPLQPGDTIRKGKLTEKGAFGKSVEIPTGMRVLTISVDDTHTNSGLLQAGDRVDVLVTYNGMSFRGPVTKTKTLLEYIEVFATDERTASKVDEKKDSNRAKNVSLLLSPEQVAYVVQAQRKGTLSLAWRHRGDDELAQTKAIDDKLLEELEGSVGLHDGGVPLYGHHFGDGAVEDSADEGAHGAQPQTASNFLNATMQGQTAASPAVTPAPTPEVWTVQIYNGNNPVEQQFALASPPKDAAAATESGVSVKDLLKSLWGGKASKSDDAHQLPTLLETTP